MAVRGGRAAAESGPDRARCTSPDSLLSDTISSTPTAVVVVVAGQDISPRSGKIFALNPARLLRLAIHTAPRHAGAAVSYGNNNSGASRGRARAHGRPGGGGGAPVRSRSSLNRKLVLIGRFSCRRS